MVNITGRMAARHVPPDVKSLGEAVRILREDQGLTLRALAEKVGVTAPFLSDLEHGRRQTDRHEKLAAALNVPVDELRQLDSRLSPDLKDWLAANPKLVALLKDMQSSGRPVPLEALRSTLRRRG
ncbi:MAG TPA: helix-turn-helix transcriptional regulator [Polyangiaceae bacterium]|jgi:transcriptional regulator with XRE-family HTH domain